MATIKKEFEIGDPVIWKHTVQDKDYYGRVANIDKFNKNYHVYVDFGGGFHEWFTADGRWELEDEASLFHAEPFWQAVISEGRLSATCPEHTLKVVILSELDGISVSIFDGDVWKCNMSYPHKEGQ